MSNYSPRLHLSRPPCPGRDEEIEHRRRVGGATVASVFLHLTMTGLFLMLTSVSTDKQIAGLPSNSDKLGQKHPLFTVALKDVLLKPRVVASIHSGDFSLASNSQFSLESGMRTGWISSGDAMNANGDLSPAAVKAASCDPPEGFNPATTRIIYTRRTSRPMLARQEMSRKLGFIPEWLLHDQVTIRVTDKTRPILMVLTSPPAQKIHFQVDPGVQFLGISFGRYPGSYAQITGLPASSKIIAMPERNPRDIANDHLWTECMAKYVHPNGPHLQVGVLLGYGFSSAVQAASSKTVERTPDLRPELHGGVFVEFTGNMNFETGEMLIE